MSDSNSSNKPAASAAKTVKVTLVKSAIGYKKSQGLTLKALGLSRIGQTVERADTPAVRGMIQTVIHLVRVG
ncbi:MAG TPA: 50S ribosomal protein L30 [Thermoflexales bacterium]|nr:50S ribosomal protein L30 [Thermoflexales bacterium]